MRSTLPWAVSRKNCSILPAGVKAMSIFAGVAPAPVKAWGTLRGARTESPDLSCKRFSPTWKRTSPSMT